MRRPARAPCGDPAALSWDCAALRGHRPDLASAATGSARPARRFDALRALAWPSLPSRLSPDGGPPCAFASLQRSIAAPPHRPADPKACSSNDASSRGLSRLATHDGTTDPHSAGLPAPLRAVSGVWVPPSRLSPSSLPTPCGVGASLGFTLQGLLPVAIGTPLGVPCPPGVRRVDSPHPHGERADAVAYRASISQRARSALPSPEGPGASMPSWVLTLQSTLSARLSPPLWFAGDPLARVGRFDVPSRLRHRVSKLGWIG